MSTGVAALAIAPSLSGCLGRGSPEGSAFSDPAKNNPSGSNDLSSQAEGSFHRPYTVDNPGPFGDGASLRNPQLFASIISSPDFTTQTLRLWAEVLDAADAPIDSLANPTFDVLAQESLCLDPISELRIIDEDSKAVLASRTLADGSHPRLITTLSLGASQRVAVYARIDSKGGWWRGPIYTKNELEQRNPTSPLTRGAYGSLRQPLSRFNAGFLATTQPNSDELVSFKDYRHQGVWQAFGRQGLRWILADFQTSGIPDAHGDWTPSHSFKGGYVFDQNDQLISDTDYQWGDTGITLTTQNGRIAAIDSGVTATSLNLGGSALNGTSKDVPYLTFPRLPEGVTSLRIVWLCSFDGWWESRIGHI